MRRWRFYQGLRTEWRWYCLDEAGNVLAESDQGFAELRGCMANAESAGFTGRAYQVYARQAGTFASSRASVPDSVEDAASGSIGAEPIEDQPAP